MAEEAKPRSSVLGLGAAVLTRPSTPSARTTPQIEMVETYQELRTLLQSQEERLTTRLEVARRQREEWSTKQERLLRQSLHRQRRLEDGLSEIRELVAKQQDQVDEVVDGLRSVVLEKQVARHLETQGLESIAPDVSVAAHDMTKSTPPNLPQFQGNGQGPHVAAQEVLVVSQKGAIEGDAMLRRKLGFCARVKHCVHGFLSRTFVPSDKTWYEVMWGDYSSTALGGVVTSRSWDVVCAIVICINGASLGFASQKALDDRKEGSTESTIAESIFFIFYLFEVVARLYAFRMHFFTNSEKRWNVFDLFLLFSSAYDLWIQWRQVLQKNEEIDGTVSGNIKLMRLLRLLKMLKMLHIVRVMRFFRELRLMIYSIFASVRALFWSMLMLILVMYFFGLCFFQAATSHATAVLSDVDKAENQTLAELEARDQLADLLRHWGSVGKCMVSLYMAVTGGHDWGPLAEPLREVGPITYGLFLFYIAFVTFAVLNVLTGIFVDAAMQVADLDREKVISAEIQKEQSVADDLRTLFHDIDADKSGAITWEEFENVLNDDVVRAYFLGLDLDMTEARELFRILDDNGRNKVKVEDFINGCMKVKGVAKSVDMLGIVYDTKENLCQIEHFMTWLEESFSELHCFFERLGAGKSVVQPLSRRRRMLQQMHHMQRTASGQGATSATATRGPMQTHTAILPRE
mmetsp:Transcript_26840/g.61900  ORF Transcript_26840/g.61900 Transcript_26840/m.61900 type:complete len:689 (-) Transcript_26840:22-2088(-)